MSEANWYYARGREQVGPVTLEELVRQIAHVAGEATLVYGPGMTSWMEARHVQAVVDEMRGTGRPPPIPSHSQSDQIQYEIFGTVPPGEGGRKTRAFSTAALGSGPTRRSTRPAASPRRTRYPPERSDTPRSR